MSAGFSTGDATFWGTNGVIESYIEAMADEAAIRFGPDASLTVFLQGERESFFNGKVIFLDDWIAAGKSRQQIVEVLDAATETLLEQRTFSDYGQQWIKTVIAGLRSALESMNSDGT